MVASANFPASAIRAMQNPHDPMRGNIEALLQAPIEPHPDEELIALGAAYDKAVSERGVAGHLFEEAELRADSLRPADPEALIITNFDVMDGFPFDGCRRHSARGRTWTDEQIAEIREAPPRQGYYLGGGKPAGMRINEKAERRKAVILAAYDAHAAAVKVVEDACGLTAAEAEYDRLIALSDNLERKIITTAAKTLTGVTVKVRVYAEMWGPPRISDHSDTDHQIIQSVFVDLALLGGKA